MSKYKLGDKFVIEIGTILGGGGKYLIKGFNTLCFDDNGLDRLDRYSAEGVWRAGYKTGYEAGLNGAKKAEIKVGDEVIDSNEILFVVTEVHMDTATVMNCVGHSYQLWKSGLKKTGRHFPIEDILEQMRGE